MQLAGWLRSTLWRADDWRVALGHVLDGVRGDGARACDVGRAFEHIEPDRSKALDAYLAAHEAGAASALGSARRIAREIRAHGVLARLALDEADKTSDPNQRLAGAHAYIDAGEPQRAARTLAGIRSAPPAELERINGLRAACEGGLRDARGEVGRWLERAVDRNDVAAAMQAIRLSRLGNLPDEQQQRVLRVALDRFPNDEDIASRVEDHLIARGDADELLTFYKMRLALRQGARAWAEEVRGAATRLCVRGIAPGLGLRLLRKGLEHAYGAGLVDVPGHLAVWALLVEHARKVRATLELMGLAVDALRLPLQECDRLWLARFGLEVAWKDVGDTNAATAYAAIVLEVAPEHPMARQFVAAQDVPLDLDGESLDLEDEPRAAASSSRDDGDDPTVAELALSLVYLDEHGERFEEEAGVAARTAGLAAAAIQGAPFVPPSRMPTGLSAARPPAAAAAPPPAAAAKQTPEPRKAGVIPAWMSPTTAEIAAVSAEAVEAASEVVAAASASTTPAPPPLTLATAAAPPPSEHTAEPPKRITGPMIPTVALDALRRIGQRVRPPTRPPLPENARDRAARVVVPVDATVELDDGTTVAAVVRDISTTGLFLVLDTPLATGSEITLTLGLPSKDDPLSISRHRAWAKVVRAAGGGYGLVFLDPEPELVEAISALT
jgi:hypothetical protein